MSKKTSFKDLLSKGASNPRVNVQNVRDQRQRVESLKRGSSVPTQLPPAKRPTSLVAARPALPAPTSSAVTAATRPAFISAPTFTGLRPGYAFKNGLAGIGYYCEGSLEEGPMAARPFANPKTAPEEAEAIEAAVGATSALPTDFFDNPQMDPANKGKAKALASTRKEQTLRDEMEEFQRAVSADLKAADVADAEDEEDEAEAAAREEAVVAHDMQGRVRQLRERRAEAGEAVGTERAAAEQAAGASGGGASSDDDDDDDDDKQVDWRSKIY